MGFRSTRIAQRGDERWSSAGTQPGNREGTAAGAPEWRKVERAQDTVLSSREAGATSGLGEMGAKARSTQGCLRDGFRSPSITRRGDERWSSAGTQPGNREGTAAGAQEWRKAERAQDTVLSSREAEATSALGKWEQEHASPSGGCPRRQGRILELSLGVATLPVRLPWRRPAPWDC
mmetsp:Transcript_119884/g.274690  ORF Transcript_119884/g.274690 Transcript_119884/m.274690 type:complete len:177 (-) Transcript_119884:13-543(-)